MKVTITGATGLIGRALAARLIARGDQVVALGRDVGRVAARLPGARALAWEVGAGPPPAEALEGSDAVVHLAGEPVADHRWSDAQKRRIRDSRVLGTRSLVAGLAAAGARPRALVSGSAIGYYGDRGDEPLDEQSSPGRDFLAGVVSAWEAEASAAERLGMRVVLARSGIVLAREGGALPRLALPFRLFAGGRLGDGRQWMSWIHLEDEVGLLLHALDRDALSGPVNLVAPAAARNAEMARAIGRALGRPALVPAPTLALRLALGERVEVLLASQRVRPAAAEAAGYSFRFAALQPALNDLLRRP
jgi:uncharacterized protein (TIGR01777 family)